jgi:hypothetical protein
VRTFDQRLATVPDRPIQCYRCSETVVPGSLAIESILLDLYAPYEEDVAPEAPALRVADASFDPALLELERDEEPRDAYRNARNTVWHHPDCALDVYLHATTTLLQRCKKRDDQLEQLYRKGLQRRRVANAIARARAGGRTVNDDAVERVEPAMDRKGRPRVSVLVIGSGSSSTSWAWLAFDHATHDQTFASPLREYAFTSFGGRMTDDVATDPSQPLVATVYLSIASVKIVKNQREKLGVLRSLGAPAPALWILGPETRDPATRDAKVLELRAELERVGFRADEAPVFCSEKLDEQALREFVALLDGQRAEGPIARSLADSIENALVAAETAIRERSLDQYAALWRNFVQEVSLKLPGTTLKLSPALTERAFAAALACAKEPSSRDYALAFLLTYAPNGPVDAIAQCARAMFDEPGRALSKDFALAHAILKQWGFDALDALVVDGILHEPGSKLRRDALRPLLTRCANDAIAERLRAAAEPLKAKDPQKSELVALALSVEARADKAKKKKKKSPEENRS